MLSWLINAFFGMFDTGITDSIKVDLGASLTLTVKQDEWKSRPLLDPAGRQKPVPQVTYKDPEFVEIKRIPRPQRAEDNNKK